LESLVRARRGRYLLFVSRAAIALPAFDELYARIQALPEGTVGEILEPGVLRTMSRPGKAHRQVAKRCERSLDQFDKNVGGAGWWIESEAEIRLPGGRLAVPDLSAWRVDRVPELPDENPVAILPDWCCEVLSPIRARDDRAVKLPLYARSGVPWVWLIDPVIRLIEVFETAGGRPVLVETAQEEDRRALPPFDGELAIGSWWPTAAPA
jgi:Uma2 family endonuclease